MRAGLELDRFGEASRGLKRTLRAILALLALIPAAAGAQGYRAPQPMGYVNDFAGVIPPEAEAAMLRVIDDVRAKSGGEIVVVTLDSLGGYPASDVALEIGRQWRVGRSGDAGDVSRNTGTIILLAMKERSGRAGVFIEDGAGTFTGLTRAVLKAPTTNWDL